MLLADTHVHIYPCHDAAACFAAAFSNLAALAPAPDCAKAVFLTERHDCSFFTQLATDEVALSDFRVERTDSAEVLRIRRGDESLYLFAGRQIVTAERLEVHCLTVDACIPDGQPLLETLDQVASAAGIAVLPWGLGKWWFSRGRVLSSLLSDESRVVLLGDSALRPAGLPGPRHILLARSRGTRILAGSDPLPLSGEERRIGTYATLFRGRFDPNRPLESARLLLADGGVGVEELGKRLSMLQVAVRNIRMKAVRANTKRNVRNNNDGHFFRGAL